MKEASAKPEVQRHEQSSNGRDTSSLWLRRLLDLESGASSGAGPQGLGRLLAPSAELGSMLGSVRRAHLLGGPSDEAEACVVCAEGLVQRMVDLEEAVRLARRAVALGRRGSFLSQGADWLTWCGHPLEASQLLRAQVEDTDDAHESAQLLAKAARLLAHEGDTRGAMTQLLWACSRDTTRGECEEVAGLVAAAGDLSEAPSLLLEAARRFAVNDESERSFGALRTAFDLAPADSQVCAALVAVLDEIGRGAAADQILRVHAQASETEHAVEIHAARIRRLVDSGQVPSALAALADARFAVPALLDEASLVEELLDKVGLHELLALRLEREIGHLTGEQAAGRLACLARLYMGRLANPERAVEVWIEALQQDPGSEDARNALRTHARLMGDQTPLVEALIRVGLRDRTDDATASCLAELASVAEERLADPALASWAIGRLVRIGKEPQANRVALDKLAPRVRLQESALRSARDAASRPEQPSVRVDALRRMASILRGRPDELDAYIDTLLQLVVLTPTERRWWIDLERASLRAARGTLYEKSLRDRIALGASRSELQRLRTSLVIHALRSGDFGAAQQESNALLADVPANRFAHCALWMVGAATDGFALQAQAMEQLAPFLSTPVRAVTLALATERYLSLGDLENASRMLDAAMRADATEPRVVDAQVAVAVRLGDVESIRALESAWSILIPLGLHCEALLEAAEATHNAPLAFTWAHRCFKLRTWDSRVLARLASCAIRVGNVESIGLAIDAAFDAVSPATDLAVIFDGVFRAFVALEPSEMPKLVRRLLHSFGVGCDAMRNLLLELAAADAALLADVYECCIVAVPLADRPSFLLRAADAHQRAGRCVAEASVLVRALQSGASAREWAERAVRIAGSTSDSDVSLLCSGAHALLQEADAAQSPVAQRDAWRRYACLLWDLASDTCAAIDAWLRAAQADPTGETLEALVLDLEPRVSEPGAFSVLLRAIEAQSEPREKATLLLTASLLAIRAGNSQDALDCARRAIHCDNARIEALQIIERVGDGAMVADAIDSAFTLAASASQGNAERRAAHLRAAKSLEQKGYAELAMPHAIAAFEAKPLDGDSLSTMLRLANRVGASDVLAALERVADATEDTTKRAAWFRRAASLASRSSETRGVAVDYVLRALSLDPTVETASLLCDIVERQIEFSPDDRDMVDLRLQRASRGILGRLEGERGARVALLLARASIESVGAVRLGVTWTEIAVDCSTSIDEYDSLVAHADLFATDRERCEALLDKVLHRERATRGIVGSALLRLCSSICAVLGDKPRQLSFGRLADSLDGHRDEQALEHVSTSESACTADEPTVAPVSLTQASEETSGAVQEEVSFVGASPMAVSRPPVAISSASQEAPTSASVLQEADLLAQRGELASAIQMLEGIEVVGFDSVEIDRRLRLLYEATGRNSQLCLVLGRLADRAQDAAERLQILIEIAGVLEARGDMDGARVRWSQVADLEPLHPDASAFLERDAVQRGDYERLVWLLHRRVKSASSIDDIRATKMRLAAVLEGHLGRVSEAREQLDDVLASYGENTLVLRALAELQERSQGVLAAAPIWERAARIASKQSDVVAFACKAASAYMAGNRDEDARAALRIANDPRSTDVLTILGALERRKGDHRALGAVLEQLAVSSLGEPSARVRLLDDAAREAALVDDFPVAIERVERGLRLSNHDGGLLLTRILTEYRSLGLGDASRCAENLETLDAISDSIEERDEALHAFLASEQIGALRGAEAALEQLQRWRSVKGSHPLISLALAERLAATGRHEESLPLFDEALLSKELMGLRTREQIAFAAARAALLASGELRAQPYIAIVEESSGSVEMAARLKREIEIIRAGVQAVAVASRQASSWRPPPVTPRSSSSSQSIPAQRASSSSSEVATVRGHSTRPLPVAQPTLTSAVLPSKPTLVSLREQQLVAELTPSIHAAAVPRSAPIEPLVYGERTSFHPDGSRPAFGEVPKMQAGEEQMLLTQLAEGDLTAGDRLAESLARDPLRSHDLVGIRRRQVVICPSEIRLLVALRDAALADRSIAHARAVDHVICTLLGQQAPKPPAVPSMSESPERLMKILFRGVHTDASQALSDVWENAGRIFSKDPAAYGVSGAERVVLGATSVLGQVYSSVAPAMGLARTPLFHRRTTGQASIGLALMSQPAILVSGELGYSEPELAYRIACMLAATLPQNVLLFGLSREQARDLLGALVAAFGPPGGKVSESSTVLLAGELWKALPARVQRRMHEVFARPDAITYEDLWARALQSARRMGLYVVGDLSVVLASVLDDPEMAERVDPNAPDRLLKLCQVSASAADLVRLATGADFAEVRWRDDGFERRHSQWNRPSGIPR